MNFVRYFFARSKTHYFFQFLNYIFTDVTVKAILGQRIFSSYSIDAAPVTEVFQNLPVIPNF